jgi:acetylornithine deacetylase/succinyl-diaminopimelate desuccinylase-like protein
MLVAHLDTVFPIGTPIAVKCEGDILRGPGISDNSVGLATLISIIDLLDELELTGPVDLVAAAVVGEEGLGNLRGTRAAVERFRKDLGAVIVIDGQLGHIVNAAVGSKRWRITVHGSGGHSYGSFGQPSAIHGLARIIAAIADLRVPQDPKTTYNVGMIEGGTSVNTIAPFAEALIDMRSIDSLALEKLAVRVRDIVEHMAGSGLRTEIEDVGERPAGKRDKGDPLVSLAAQTLTWLGHKPIYVDASTDANVPISLNIPSVCIGVTRGERVHTLDEYMYVSPIGEGLAHVSRLALEASLLISSTSTQ